MTRRSHPTALALALALALTIGMGALPAAQAEESPPADSEVSIPVQSAPEVRYKAKTEIDFGERKVEGQLAGPAGSLALARGDQSWNPLIRLRTNFDQEMEASVLAIR